MNQQSIVQHLGAVTFPAFMAERVYMHEFRKESGLPVELQHWQPTVDAMLQQVDTDGPIYLMVDQKALVAGELHRRPGVHVDGYWHPALQAHGGGHGSVPGHRPAPAPRHGGISAKGRWDTPNNWAHADFSEPEGIILASDVQACRAYVGSYTGIPGEGGDFSHLDLNQLDQVALLPGQVYAGNVSMLHETLPVAQACTRTLVRLNVPGWTPKEMQC